MGRIESRAGQRLFSRVAGGGVGRRNREQGKAIFMQGMPWHATVAPMKVQLDGRHGAASAHSMNREYRATAVRDPDAALIPTPVLAIPAGFFGELAHDIHLGAM